MIRALGDDPDRPGLERTPERVAETLMYLTRGQREDIRAGIEDGLFADESRDMVVVRDIEFASLCEHHMLPFLGHAHVAYVPDGRILGLSRFARVVDHFACRLQVQERLTRQVADHLVSVLRPKGLGVVVTATHLCMVARGVRKQDSDVTTMAWRGSFESEAGLRAEVLAGLPSKRNGK
ncbi:MAG: GTP cyclohydrolase I FolE [Deltaproteobacteria bacterium]|nr:GTP cyclohydrolase I FolE [Deltaproteobacteria bacterium]